LPCLSHYYREGGGSDEGEKPRVAHPGRARQIIAYQIDSNLHPLSVKLYLEYITAIRTFHFDDIRLLVR
jgi:hypothetical protein